jgi:hypothetical protein
MKKLKITLLLLLLTTITFAQGVNQNPPVRGIGIVVKKKPSNGSAIKTKTNEKGEAEFKIKEKGDYVITLTEPNNTAAKTENHGDPIKGVKVGLGKNPPGAVVARATTNDNGEVEFKGLEPGSYYVTLELSGRCSKCSALIADIRDLPAHEKTCSVTTTSGMVKENMVSTTSINELPTAESQHSHKLDLIVGAGVLTPNTELKENAYLQNMTSATLGIRMSVLDKNWWDLGIKLKGTYLTGNKEPALPQQYNVEIQTSATVALKVDGSPRQTGFIAEVGPELDIYIVKGLILSAGVNVGYASLTCKPFSVLETIDYNATLYNYNLLTVNEVKLSGISVTPSLNLKYKFGRVTVWSAIDRVTFPKVTVTGNSFSPNGAPMSNGEYLITQMQTGTNKNFENTVSGSTIGVSGGVTIDLGRKSNYVGHVTLLR